MNEVKPVYLDIIIDADFVIEDSPHYPLIKDQNCRVDWDNKQQDNGPRIRTRVDLFEGKIVNWKEEYPYAPQAKFRLAHIGESLLVDYCVTEESVAAVATHDNGRVWEDSCCELFIEPEAGGPYYNIECNCAGMLLIACGAEREGREPASPAILSGVKRWSSLGRSRLSPEPG